MRNRYVYLFTEGSGEMRNLLGGKGANLAEMTKLGLPVPMGFTVTTEVCNRYYKDKEQIAPEIIEEIREKLAEMERICGKKFGDMENPLLVSVRSGARASMPGMMDTILNLGLNDETAEGLARLTGNERFAYDSYRRFIQMFSDVVMGVSKESFEALLERQKKKKNVTLDTELTAEDMRCLVSQFKELYESTVGMQFPKDPKEQLLLAITAVFRSWENPRAITYRRLNDIPSSWGTAVNVQMMVFGNMGENSGTGVAFTRNPATGENKLYGEYLINAQGEDVVAGIRTPQEIATLRKIMPKVYDQFEKTAKSLENHYKDMQDMEFTIEKGKLYMLQTRNGKRTAHAALKIAVDLVSEGMITKEEALLKVEPRQLDTLLHPTFSPEILKTAKPIANGLPASPGAACGKVCFTAADAVQLKKKGERALLVRQETSAEDIEGMAAAVGILTAKGGMTSHAAVVARGMGTCCVAGCSDIHVSEQERIIMIEGDAIEEGEYLSIDGSTGKVYYGELPTVEAEMSENFDIFMGWADEVRTLKIRTNADTPKDAKQALSFGAEGIGLCRTEHMFFEADRILAVREMILSKSIKQRERALSRLLPIQKEDFAGLFTVMGGLPVTIRLLDPPLHEFLPTDDEDIRKLSEEMDLGIAEIRHAVKSMHEFNPMLGHRGCRLAVTYPEIGKMQTQAIIEAAIQVKREGIDVKPEIMVPLVGDAGELKYVKNIIKNTADEIIKNSDVDISYTIGTMIEVPRAALTADQIAKEAEFFSFGTNDLTQMTYGLSRDDAGGFLDAYYSKKIFESDPFQRLDQTGVGTLIEMAASKGKAARQNIKLGICGEHGGDPSSVEFCHKVGLNYVSCSPYRVPIARLAAAQAKVKFG